MGKTKHNYRLMPTPNADAERTASLNQELVNTNQLDYWTLAEKRIDEGIAKTKKGEPRKVRDDQVRAVEVLLTASPEWFKRGEDGQANDMRGSKWVEDNLAFLKKRYGEKNLLSFTLHQDEKTPHIHAVIVPLTEKGRLSADTLFNPLTLKQLQTDYAKAMASHGLVRGQEGSRRQHLDMKQMYGLQDKTAVELNRLAVPVATTPAKEVELGKLPPLGYRGEEWRDREQARINAELVRQVQEANERTELANKRAQEAMQYALANASGRERAELLERQLNISEGLKQGNYDKVQELAMRLAAGEAPPKGVLQSGQQALDRAFEEIKTGREELAKLHERLTKAEQAFDIGGTLRIRYEDLPPAVKRQDELETRFRGFNGGAERLDELGKQLVIEASQKAEKAEKAEKDRVLKAEKAEKDREEKLAAEQRRTEGMKEVAKQEQARRDKEAAQKVATHELALMDQAFGIYRWKVGPNDLTACLIVPKEKVDNVVKALRVEGSSWAAPLRVQGEPPRRDGQEAVYVKYEASFAHQASSYFDKVRAGGSNVYEHATHQTRREQLHAQPEQKVQERKQEPIKTKGFGIGD